MTKLIYVASPIDRHTTDGVIKEAVDKITTSLTGSGAIVFHPERAFKVPNTRYYAPTGQVREINNRALDISQGLLVFLPLQARTWGVPAEIERAIMRGKPVALVTIGTEPLSWSQTYTEVSHFRCSTAESLWDPLLVQELEALFGLERPTFDEVIQASLDAEEGDF